MKIIIYIQNKTPINMVIPISIGVFIVEKIKQIQFYQFSTNLIIF